MCAPASPSCAGPSARPSPPRSPRPIDARARAAPIRPLHPCFGRDGLRRRRCGPMLAARRRRPGLPSRPPPRNPTGPRVDPRPVQGASPRPVRERKTAMLDGTTWRVPSCATRSAPEEWQARVDCAAFYRLVDAYGMSDLIANHISVRVPGEDAFLINAYGMLYEEITASSLMKIDYEGNIILKPDFPAGTDYGVNRAGFVIHSRDPQGQARHRLRRAHPHLGRHGGLDAGMRAAAEHPDQHALRPYQLPRLRRRGDRPGDAGAAGRGPRRQQRDDPAQPRAADRGQDHPGMLERAAPAGTVLPHAARRHGLRHAS